MMFRAFLLVVVAVALPVFVFAVPVIPARTVYVEHCNWYATRWESVGYVLFGVGASRWDRLCQ